VLFAVAENLVKMVAGSYVRFVLVRTESPRYVIVDQSQLGLQISTRICYSGDIAFLYFGILAEIAYSRSFSVDFWPFWGTFLLLTSSRHSNPEKAVIARKYVILNHKV